MPDFSQPIVVWIIPVGLIVWLVGSLILIVGYLAWKCFRWLFVRFYFKVMPVPEKLERHQEIMTRAGHRWSVDHDNGKTVTVVDNPYGIAVISECMDKRDVRLIG